MSPLPVALPAATIVMGAAGLAAWAGLSAGAQLFGPALVAPPAARQLALTFDDGPNPACTPRLLEVLARHRVRAAFFLIGRWVLAEPGLTREIAAAGHVIGNHTQHHPWLPRLSRAAIDHELTACNRTIEDTLGAPVRLFRPPHGARRPAVLRSAAALGLTTVQWNLIVGDWNPHTPQALVERVGRGIERHRAAGRGTCLVLHDGGQHDPRASRMATVEAVDALLMRLGGAAECVVPPDWQ